MNKILLLFITAIFCGHGMAQETHDKEEVIMSNPIVWGVMVYIEAEKSVKEQLLKELESNKKQLHHVCSSGPVHWVCNKAPEVVFQALDGYGKPINEAMLCEESYFLKEYKYFNKEILTQNDCLVAIWAKDVNSYEFHTADAWFGDECE